MAGKMEKPGFVRVSPKEFDLIKREFELRRESIRLKIKELECELERLEFEHEGMEGEQVPIAKCRGQCRGKDNND